MNNKKTWVKYIIFIAFLPIVLGYYIFKGAHPHVTKLMFKKEIGQVPQLQRFGSGAVVVVLILAMYGTISTIAAPITNPPAAKVATTNTSTASNSQAIVSQSAQSSSISSSIATSLATSQEIETARLASEQAQKVAEAVKVTDVDTGDNNTTQDTTVAVAANTKIADLGTTTQGQKLFDVLQVVDGDTIKISELGTLRLIGLDTPETKDPRKPVQCFGEEASKNATNLLAGKKVYLEFDTTQGRIDKYGRTLAYVYREDGYFYNLKAIADGYANEYTYNLPYKYQTEFKAASKNAQANKLGLWSPTTCNGDAKQAAVTSQVPPPVVVPNSTPAPPAPKPQPISSPAPATNNAPKFANCTEAKAAGYGNMMKGTDAYAKNSGLDRDKDGIACDK